MAKTNIVCTVCHVTVDQCVCPDADAKLKHACDDPHVMFKWCRLCDRHFARCQCALPDFYVRSGGVEVQMPTGGFRDVTGRRQIPDFKER